MFQAVQKIVLDQKGAWGGEKMLVNQPTQAVGNIGETKTRLKPPAKYNNDITKPHETVA